jgi:ABC-type uncharacterized transport system involved in gliding motility auxiliary subunit
MQLTKQRLAPLGLLIALLAILASGGLYIVQREFSLAVKISLGISVIGLALFALLDPDRARRALTGRQARYGSNALVISLAFLGILIVINYLVVNNNKRWDLTEDKQNSLAQETLDTLKALPEPVHVQAFFTNNFPSDSASRLLDNYAQNSEGKFTFEFINPDTQPMIAQQASITRDGSLLVTMGDTRSIVDTASETDLTNALVRLMSGSTKQIYFLTGHGERDPNGSSENAYSKLRQALTDKNYNVSVVSLLAQSSIPVDADLLVVAGPTEPLLAGEVKQLSQYLEDGGALMILWEPSLLVNFGETPDLLSEYLLDDWGILVGDDVIVDLVGQQYMGQPFMAVGTEMASHQITNSMEGLATFFFTARTVSVDEVKEGITLTELVKTSTDSWAETNLQGMKNQEDPVFDPDDRQGPLPLVIVAENTSTTSRLIVVGDADFTSDNSYSLYGNSDLMLNAIDWAVGQEDVIALTVKETTTRSLTLTPSTTTLGLLFLISVIVLPLSALVLGAVAFVYRRRRG